MRINLCYVVLCILMIFVGMVYLRDKKVTNRQKLVMLGIYLLFTTLTFTYFNSIIYNIFKLKFLNVKAYLFLLVISNFIILYTLNKPLHFIYRIINYIYFMILMILFGASLSVVLGDKFHSFYLMDVENAVHFVDLSFVMFLFYLITISFIYIGFSVMKKDDVVIYKDWWFSKACQYLSNKISIRLPHFSLFHVEEDEDSLLTPYEILNWPDQDELYINGVDASIIFEDSNQENIVKNYYILNDDIHAKLMNGYTLDENKLFKSICMKLHVSTLRNIDFHDRDILDMMNMDEYNLLKRVFNL